MPAANPNPCVLIADNDAAVNSLLRGILIDRGLSCESVHDGAAALARVESGGVDVLVTDLDMPVVDGHELLARLARLAQPPQTIVVSGYVDAEVESRLRQVPAVRHILRKPFDVLEFADLVETLVNG